MTGGGGRPPADGAFEPLADAVALIREWERTAADESRDLRDRNEARLRAEGAREILAKIRRALGDPG
jgi:hypothetical protein